jgi:hypothetical protein
LTEGNSFEDSDDESDKVALALAATRTSRTIPAGVREIVVDFTAYTTYHAVLIWMLYGYIEFSQLSQVSFAPDISSIKTRSASTEVDHALALPASPKSVYKLAHFLELPDLMALALDNLKSQLTTNNVLYQVISDVAVHDEVFDAIAAFAKSRWQTIKGSQAAVELGKPEALQAVGLEGMGRLFELARR